MTDKDADERDRNRLHALERWHWKDASRHVSADFRPGLKVFSVAAAVATLNTEATITYMTSRGPAGAGGEFRTFDGRVEILGDATG